MLSLGVPYMPRKGYASITIKEDLYRTLDLLRLPDETIPDVIESLARRGRGYAIFAKLKEVE